MLAIKPIKNTRKQATLMLAANQLLGQFFNFLRNVLLARMLGAEEIGKAALVACLLSVLEMTSDFGVDKIIIQDRKGGWRSFQATCHSVLIARGLILCLIFLLGARPILAYFDIDLTSGLYWIAMLPLVRGFTHADIRRFQRRMHFTSWVKVEISSHLLAALLVVPMCHLFRDFHAVIACHLLQAVTFVLGSHLLARRQYQVRFDSRVFFKIAGFGWPLMMNGFIIYLVMQGDRMLISHVAGAALLGAYFIHFNLMLIPTLMLSRVHSGYWLPRLSSKMRAGLDQDPVFKHFQVMIVLSTVLFLGVLLITVKPVVRIIYGDEFSISGLNVLLLICTLSIRIVREVPSQLAVAGAYTRLTLEANLVRVLGFLMAIVVAAKGGSLAGIIAFGMIGETLALIYSLRLILKKKLLSRLHPAIPAIGLICPVMGLAGFLGLLSLAQIHTLLWLMMAGTCLVFRDYISQFISLPRSTFLKLKRAS